MNVVARFGSASLSQVANLLGQTEDQVAENARKLCGDEAAHRGWLKANAVAALIEDVTPMHPLLEAEPLILKAFRQARESSKSEWTSMTVPVLKNRLLQVTSNSFRETNYGSPNIWHFVTKFPELLANEGMAPGEQVRLLKPENLTGDERETLATLDPAGLGRIRQDLWRALFDYSARELFVWDETTGRARVRSEFDSENMPVIPTLSAEDMDGLRAEFVRLQEKVSDQDSVRLEEWVESRGPTVELPRMYRSLWNAHLKSHAANKLRAFFLAENLDVPKDLFESSIASAEPEFEVERVRRLAHLYIDAMTAQELSRFPIEMAVVLRVPVHREK